MNIFESEISSRFHQNWRGAFWWAKLLLFSFLLLVFIEAVRYAATADPRVRALLAVEFVALVALLLVTIFQVRRVQDYTQKALAKVRAQFPPPAGKP